MYCHIEINDNLVVTDTNQPQRVLKLDISKFYCRLFETTQQQSRDYLEEILKWADGETIENYDYVAKNLLHCTSAQRRHYGFKK